MDFESSCLVPPNLDYKARCAGRLDLDVYPTQPNGWWLKIKRHHSIHSLIGPWNSPVNPASFPVPKRKPIQMVLDQQLAKFEEDAEFDDPAEFFSVRRFQFDKWLYRIYCKAVEHRNKPKAQWKPVYRK